MPGGYAHLTAVDLLVGGRDLEALNIPGQAILALKQNLKFCELGAVSPDYPYLDVRSGGSAKAWADLMHYQRTGDIIKAAARRVRALDGADKGPALAWLLGYTAHVAMDLSLHPVIERRVGPYEGNETAHRDCEMHQDVHIFRRMNLGGLDDSDPVRTGIKTCGGTPAFKAVTAVWEGALADVHPDTAAGNPPKVASWHGWYTHLVDAVGSALAHFPFARHVVSGYGLVYPLVDELDASYLEKLPTPDGSEKHYDALFDWALGNVGRWWQAVALGVLDDPKHLDAIVNTNLDRGIVEGGPDHGAYVFWSGRAPELQA